MAAEPVVYGASERPPRGDYARARPDYTCTQDWNAYTAQDHDTYRRLYERQSAQLPGLACDTFIAALPRLGARERIPRLDDISEHLHRATGWKLVAVEGLLPEETFFSHLAAREFPVTWWIRTPEQLDYLSEPDLFHDLFGHVPLLMNPVFAEYMRAYGLGGLKAMGIGGNALQHLARLYWYTVEFGLIRSHEGLRIYGSGILSSAGESRYSLASDAPNRIEFNMERVMRTRYRIDSFQRSYFVIDSFEQLFEATMADFTPIYARLGGQRDLAAGDIVPGDVVLNQGTGEGWGDGADA